MSMLALRALQEMLNADLSLADMLEEQQVLDLIPYKSKHLFVARKFTGKAKRLQQEF